MFILVKYSLAGRKIYVINRSIWPTLQNLMDGTFVQEFLAHVIASRKNFRKRTSSWLLVRLNKGGWTPPLKISGGLDPRWPYLWKSQEGGGGLEPQSPPLDPRMWIGPPHPLVCRKRRLSGDHIWGSGLDYILHIPLCVVRGDWMGRSFRWDRKNRRPVSQHVWHDR
jgi:hypothetical protein